MTKNQSTTNPEENQIVTNDHFGTIRAKVNKTKEENKTFVFVYESDDGEKEARSHIHKLRGLNGKIDSTHKTAKAEALEKCQAVDAVKNDLRKDVAEMIAFHMDPINAKIARKEKEAAVAAEIEKQRLRLEDAHQMNDLFNRERDVRIAEEKIEEQKKADEKIKEDARIEKERIENEEKIKKEAAAQAKLEADNKAKAEKEAIEQEKQDAIAAKDKAEKATEDARIKAEADKKAEADRVEKEKQAAIIKAEKETQAAIDKVKKDQAIKEAAEKKVADDLAETERIRQANTENQRTKNKEALACLKTIGLSPEDAQKTVEAIAKRQIKNIFIQY